jgi:hypothetical protein
MTSLLLRRAARRLARIQARLSGEISSEDLTLLGSIPEFDLIFADDSRQDSPSRPGMGALVAVGGLSVAASAVAELGNAIEETCEAAGFPPGEEFKWSPGRELWMRDNLVDSSRQAFFRQIIGHLLEHEVTISVVVVDGAYQSATGAQTPEEDATRLFLERVEHCCNQNFSRALVVTDRPSGGRGDEDKFLSGCVEMLQQGTSYVKHKSIVHNVVSTPSRLSRLLQAADLVTGATLAATGGERTYAPPLLATFRPMFYRDANRIGGYGLKIHPALRYMNLYHWLVGDSHFWRMQTGTPLPVAGHPYCQDPYTL